MAFQKLLVMVLIGLSLLPAHACNQWLQQIIRPRRSFGRFWLYFFTALLLVLLYTFLLVTVLVHLLPPLKTETPIFTH